jgi:hypothetical protein
MGHTPLVYGRSHGQAALSPTRFPWLVARNIFITNITNTNQQYDNSIKMGT